MKKTTFLVFLGLIATGGVGAYAFSDGMFDEIIEDFEETEEEIVEEKEPEVISTDIMAIINVNSYTGINYYQMEEVDDGDNNEVPVTVWDNYTFEFDASQSTGTIETYLWNFGDNNEHGNISGTHSYEKPGRYIVSLKVTSPDGVSSLNQTEITVNFDGSVISDNMECTCAPTAKETIVDLKVESNAIVISGETTVTHDGSSEDCTQRLAIQQCHLRVIFETYDGQSLVSDEVLFDETFDTNSKTVNFSHALSDDENGYNYKIRLETDQIRDWHKPVTEWFVTYSEPAVSLSSQ